MESCAIDIEDVTENTSERTSDQRPSITDGRPAVTESANAEPTDGRHPHDEDVERMRTRLLLLEAGIVPTFQRLEIGRIMFHGPIHISADELHRRLRERSCPISRATVYNTLKLFVAKGLLREIVANPERVFYDSTTRPHHHFYDEATGELRDIPDEAVTFRRLPSPPPGMQTAGIEVIVRIRPQG